MVPVQGQLHGRNSISISVFVFLSRFVSVFVFVSQFVSVFVSLFHLWGLVRSKGRGGCTAGTLGQRWDLASAETSKLNFEKPNSFPS